MFIRIEKRATIRKCPFFNPKPLKNIQIVEKIMLLWGGY